MGVDPENRVPARGDRESLVGGDAARRTDKQTDLNRASEGEVQQSTGGGNARESSIYSAIGGIADASLGDTGILSIVPSISRDAYEHYLFLREYMNQAGKLWSPALCGLLVYLLYLLSAYIYYMAVFTAFFLQRGILVKVLMFLLTRTAILFVYPVASIAHANSCIFLLQEAFLVSSPEDYEILGGRDKWIAFLTAVPAAWSVCGLWVTWDRLFAIFWTLVTAAAAVLFTVISNDLQ